MTVTQLIDELIKLRVKYGDLDVVVDVQSETQIFELTGLVEWDTFEPGHPGYYVLATKECEI